MRLPHWLAVHPGHLIAWEIEARKISQKKFAEIIGKSPAELSFLITGRRDVNADVAIRLEKALDISATIWLGLQNDYDLFLIEKKQAEELEKITQRAKDLVVSE